MQYARVHQYITLYTYEFILSVISYIIIWGIHFFLYSVIHNMFEISHRTVAARYQAIYQVTVAPS